VARRRRAIETGCARPSVRPSVCRTHLICHRRVDRSLWAAMRRSIATHLRVIPVPLNAYETVLDVADRQESTSRYGSDKGETLWDGLRQIKQSIACNDDARR